VTDLPVPYAAMTQASLPLPTCVPGIVGAPAGRTFEARGPQSGPLRLSLFVPASVKRGEPLLATLRLEDVSDEAMSLLSNDNPHGLDYDFVIKDARTGTEIAKRDDYIPMITRISSEAVAPGCPAFQSVSLTRSYDLPVGTYVIRARRRPARVVRLSEPIELVKLPVVQSNAVSVTVY
jgi:hypothetical protein